MNKDSLLKEIEELEEGKEGNQLDYIEELRELIKNECWRSSIVLGWSLFMHHLYSKIEEYSLEAFAEQAKEKNRDVGYLNQANDLNNMNDSAVLITAKELGILPNQLEDQLRTVQLRKRNNCAHFGSYTPSNNSVYEFYSEILDAIEKLEAKEFETRETEFLESIKKMSPEKISNLPVEGTRTKNAVRQINEELLFIENEYDYESHKNYLNYLEKIVKETKDDNIIITCLDLSLDLVNSKVYRGLSKRAEKLLSKVLKRKQAKEEIKSRPKIKQDIITSFADSGSYRQAERRMRWILKIEQAIEDEDWNQIARATAQNRQIYEARKCRKILPGKFKEYKKHISQGTLDDLSSRGPSWQNIS